MPTRYQKREERRHRRNRAVCARVLAWVVRSTGGEKKKKNKKREKGTVKEQSVFLSKKYKLSSSILFVQAHNRALERRRKACAGD